MAATGDAALRALVELNVKPVRGRVLAERLGPARIYACVGGISLLLLVILTPPFEVPDEPQHFVRSYQLSRLEVWPRRQGRLVGGELPASLPVLVERFLGRSVLDAYRDVTPQRLDETLAELKRPLEPDKTIFAAFDTGAYSPLPYIPQATAIAAGRSFGVGPLGLLYLARLANALVAWAVTWLALRAYGPGVRFALVAALLPMSQFMFASCSPDAMTIAGSFAFSAALTRFLSDHAWPSPRRWTAFVSGTVMCSIKVVLVTLLACGSASLFGRGRLVDAKLRRAVAMQLGAGLLTIALIAAWAWSVGGFSSSNPPSGVDIRSQVAHIFGDPAGFLVVIARSLYERGGFLWTSMIGILGWLTLDLPKFVYWSIGVAFVLAIYAEETRTRASLAGIGWLLVLIAGSILLTETAMYLLWTPVAAPIVEGVQGRYFIPLLPLAGYCLASLLASRGGAPGADVAYLLLVAVLVATTVSMQWTIVAGYGLFPPLPPAPTHHSF